MIQEISKISDRILFFQTNKWAEWDNTVAYSQGQVKVNKYIQRINMI